MSAPRRLIPKGKYEYSGRLREPRYFIQLLKLRGIPATCLGVTSYRDRFVIFFDRELTPDEKAILDSLVAENPEPVAIYRLAPLTPDDVEREVGARPVYMKIAPEGFVELQFDRGLTATQETKLEECLAKGIARFKRIKP